MKRLDSKSRYTDFVNARNRAIEKLLLKTRAKVSDELRQFMLQVRHEIAHTYPFLNTEYLNHQTMQLLRNMDQSLDRHAYSISLAITGHWLTLRAVTFPLAHAGEQQAVINATDGAPKKLQRDAINTAVHSPTAFGAPSDRSYLALSDIRRDVMHAVEMSRILGDDVNAALTRAMKCFPKPLRAKLPKVFAKVKESWRPNPHDPFGMSEFMTDEEWNLILEEYSQEFVPKWRDPRALEGDTMLGAGVEEETSEVSAWRLEQEIMNDIVAKVRAGEQDGAKEQGVSDFVWISVLGAHGKTQKDACEYCRKRDGLTTAEIEANLRGKWSDDDEWSKVSAPPIHPNCFCRLAPATDNLPEIPDSNEAEFNEWLNS